MSEMERERDLVLNPNEYAYVLDKTKGLISCVVGSYKMSLSTSDALVVFNEKTKRFEETGFQNAVKTFTSAPENWYVVLKNPAKEGRHPIAGAANTLPELQIGKKVNIPGNISFALYPGQMAKTIQGHRLHSNQYLLIRVYDAEAVNAVSDTDYAVGQLMIIKGTEIPFYIPPTGMKVVPVESGGDRYVRDAVTLERLEYCILKDEQGNKKYIHGAAVVFPEPDETFITNPNDGSYKFRAIELSEISGIYLKVIADYEEDGKKYRTGDELFITGKDQNIYYPRPEHAIIDYEGKVVHHAVAIPAGEGRYVLNRKTGKIFMIKGPAMYLPDPRNEVIVRRKLTKKQCELWYPSNDEVLAYNVGMATQALTVKPSQCTLDSIKQMVNSTCLQPVVVEENGISRGNTYTKPRMITIDNKFDGVVAVDVWTGYAVNIVAKDGKRKVAVGPQTCLLEYDESLEVLEMSTGKPKTTDNLVQTVYLRVSNNKISDIISVQTSDFVPVEIKVSYSVDFLDKYKDRWFAVENYVKYLTDRMRSLVKKEVKKYGLYDFLNEASTIISRAVLGENDTKKECKGRVFEENGMAICDVDILDVRICNENTKNIVSEHQFNMVKKSVMLAQDKASFAMQKEIDRIRNEIAEMNTAWSLAEQNREQTVLLDKFNKDEDYRKMQEAADKKRREAEKDIQKIVDEIEKVKLARTKAQEELKLFIAKERDKLEMDKQKVMTDNIKKVFDAVQPDLVAAMNAQTNADLMENIAARMSPYALANGESVAETVNLLLRGTPMEGVIGKLVDKADIQQD